MDSNAKRFIEKCKRLICVDFFEQPSGYMVVIKFHNAIRKNMEKSIKSVRSFIMNESLILNIEAQDGLYTTTITEDLINEYSGNLNLTVEKMRSFFEKLPIQRAKEIIMIQNNKIQIQVASLGKRGERKLFLRCPYAKVQSLRRKLDDTMEQRMEQNTQRIINLEEDNLEIKMKLEDLNFQVEQQNDKFGQIWNFVRMEMDKCKRDYERKIEDISIMISQQKSSFQSSRNF